MWYDVVQISIVKQRLGKSEVQESPRGLKEVFNIAGRILSCSRSLVEDNQKSSRSKRKVYVLTWIGFD